MNAGDNVTVVDVASPFARRECVVTKCETIEGVEYVELDDGTGWVLTMRRDQLALSEAGD